MRRIALFIIALMLGGTALAQPAYPNRPLRMVIPWPPGQATDLVARVVAQKLSDLLRQARLKRCVSWVSFMFRFYVWGYVWTIHHLTLG